MGHHHGTYSTADYISMALFGAFLLVLLLALYFLCRKKPVPAAMEKLDKQRLQPPPSVSTFTKPCARAIPFGDIDAATDGFNPRRVLGSDRLGTVFHVMSSDDHLIAVKRIRPHLVLAQATGVAPRFSSKMKSLSLLQHPNIVEIVGFSEAPGERIIVSDFAGARTSLASYLHPSAHVLSWEQRLRIAAGAARGIEYLHEGTAPDVAVHGNVKSGNVVVDDDFCARVCDYGLSFLDDRCVDKASDVYGFGVVLLEILTGRRCDEDETATTGVVDWSLPLIRAERVAELLDPRVGKPSDMRPLIRLTKVASACVVNSGGCRPSMAQVAAILNNVEMQHLGRFSSA